jgi:hypothetical protein
VADTRFAGYGISFRVWWCDGVWHGDWAAHCVKEHWSAGTPNVRSKSTRKHVEFTALSIVYRVMRSSPRRHFLLFILLRHGMRRLGSALCKQYWNSTCDKASRMPTHRIRKVLEFQYLRRVSSLQSHLSHRILDRVVHCVRVLRLTKVSSTSTLKFELGSMISETIKTWRLTENHASQYRGTIRISPTTMHYSGTPHTPTIPSHPPSSPSVSSIIYLAPSVNFSPHPRSANSRRPCIPSCFEIHTTPRVHSLVRLNIPRLVRRADGAEANKDLERSLEC